MLRLVGTGCFISTGRSLEQAIERVKLAESLGYESVYTTHVAGRESLTVLSAYAALSPAMLRLAGELADGVILWLCNPRYIREVVMAEVSAGRERAGLTLDGFDVVAAVPAALTGDRDGAYKAMRKDLIPYFGLPFYRAMIERTGFGADIEAYDRAASAGDFEAMQGAISEGFLDELTAVGDEAELTGGIERYRDAGAGSPCIGPIPGTDFEATLRAGIGV
jgi:alkanesulfonate monooxygenase SsuD/methylene tetrahydromethanopterin reductase-like flavin-dependent oxidoreductase (luciferase family)